MIQMLRFSTYLYFTSRMEMLYLGKEKLVMLQRLSRWHIWASPEREETFRFHLDMSAFTEGILWQLHTASIDFSFLSFFPAEQTPAHSSPVFKRKLCAQMDSAGRQWETDPGSYSFPICICPGSRVLWYESCAVLFQYIWFRWLKKWQLS